MRRSPDSPAIKESGSTNCKRPPRVLTPLRGLSHVAATRWVRSLPLKGTRGDAFRREQTLLVLIMLDDREAAGEAGTIGDCVGDSGGPAFSIATGTPLLIDTVTGGIARAAS